MVKPDFETNIPGIFIAGELGGMGLIRNAVEQGRQALDSIKKLGGLGKPNQLDLVIVGAGPAGIAASLGAMEAKLRFVTVEQDSLGGTVAHFPRGKLVMTRPAILPIVGKMKFSETSKEKLLEHGRKLVERPDDDVGGVMLARVDLVDSRADHAEAEDEPTCTSGIGISHSKRTPSAVRSTISAQLPWSND